MNQYETEKQRINKWIYYHISESFGKYSWGLFLNEISASFETSNPQLDKDIYNINQNSVFVEEEGNNFLYEDMKKDYISFETLTILAPYP